MVTDIVILNEFDKKLQEAENLMTATVLADVTTSINGLVVDSDESKDVAMKLAQSVVGYADSINNFWEPWREYYHSRYKAVMAIRDEGVKTAAATVTGVQALTGKDGKGALRGKIETLIKSYIRTKEADDAARQRTIDASAAQDSAVILKKAEEAMLDGNMQEARALRQQAASVPVVTIMDKPVSLGTAGDIKRPFKWVLQSSEGKEDGTLGLMKLLTAIVAGEVPLFHTVTVKGKTEQRSILQVDTVVLNQKVKELGDSLHWPGVVVTEEIDLAIRRAK